MNKEKKFMVVVNCKNKGKIKISNKNTLFTDDEYANVFSFS